MQEMQEIPELGRSPAGGNGNPLQYSCLENSMDRGAWRTWGYKELDMTAQQEQPNGDNISIYLVRMDEVSSLGQRIQVKSWFCHMLTLDKWALAYVSTSQNCWKVWVRQCDAPQPTRNTCSVKGSWCHDGSTTVRIKLELCLQMPSLVAQTVKSPPAKQGPRFNPWGEKMPWRRKWQPTPVFLPGEFQGQRSLAGSSPWGRKRVRHNWVTFTFTLMLANRVAIRWGTTHET